MNILDCIGHTPLVRLEGASKMAGANVYMKLEARNPGGSIKDRPALYYIQGAMERGELATGGCIVEATSGNLGIGLALVCAKLGIRLILTMPGTVSQERITLLRAIGVELIITPPAEGMSGATAKAEFLASDIRGAFRPNQFANMDGVKCHYENTGPEILADAKALGITIDAFVSGVGSGATISGVGKRLREDNPNIFIAAIEPAESPVLSGKAAGAHGIQGIGAGFVPKVYNATLINEIFPVSTEDAILAGRRLLQGEAINAGISSGANLHGALLMAQRPEFKGKNIVTIACDTGERYLSTQLFSS